MLISFYFCSVYWKKSTMGLNILHVLAEYARLQRLVRGSEVSAASHSRPRGDYMYPIPLLQKGRQLICLSFATMFDACKKKKVLPLAPVSSPGKQPPVCASIMEVQHKYAELCCFFWESYISDSRIPCLLSVSIKLQRVNVSCQ